MENLYYLKAENKRLRKEVERLKKLAFEGQDEIDLALYELKLEILQECDILDRIEDKDKKKQQIEYINQLADTMNKLMDAK